MKKRFLLCAILIAAASTTGCAVMEISGRATRLTGEIMTEYGANNDGLIAVGARFGGAVNTAVGTAVENAAKGEAAKNGAAQTPPSKVEPTKR